MKTNFLTITILSLGISLAHGQSTIRAGSPVEQGSPLREVKKNSSPPAGSVYLYNEWAVATLHLVKGTLAENQIKDMPMKLDLQTNTFELNSPVGIKALDGSKVEKFHFINPKTGFAEVFFNCNKFKLDGVQLTGFCKVVGTSVALATHTSVQFVPANYDVTLNRGSKEDTFVKKTSLFMVKDNNFFPANKKNLFDLMSDKETEIKKYIKEQRINTNKEEGLSLIVTYYDSISGSGSNPVPPK